MDDYFSTFTSSEDDFEPQDYPLQDIDEAFKSLLEIEYNEDGTIKHVYSDDITYSIRISTKGKTFSHNSEEGGNEFLIYLLLSFYDRQKREQQSGADTRREDL